MRELNDLFAALARSRFRSGFQLCADEATYLEHQDMDVVLEHAEKRRAFLMRRRSPQTFPTSGRTGLAVGIDRAIQTATASAEPTEQHRTN